MPEQLEHQLEQQAEKKHLKKDRKNAYVYGTMRKIMEEERTKREEGKAPTNG